MSWSCDYLVCIFLRVSSCHTFTTDYHHPLASAQILLRNPSPHLSVHSCCAEILHMNPGVLWQIIGKVTFLDLTGQLLGLHSSRCDIASSLAWKHCPPKSTLLCLNLKETGCRSQYTVSLPGCCEQTNECFGCSIEGWCKFNLVIAVVWLSMSRSQLHREEWVWWLIWTGQPSSLYQG